MCFGGQDPIRQQQQQTSPPPVKKPIEPVTNKRRGGGRPRTILTGPRGLTEEAKTKKKILGG